MHHRRRRFLARVDQVTRVLQMAEEVVLGVNPSWLILIQYQEVEVVLPAPVVVVAVAESLWPHVSMFEVRLCGTTSLGASHL